MLFAIIKNNADVYTETFRDYADIDAYFQGAWSAGGDIESLYERELKLSGSYAERKATVKKFVKDVQAACSEYEPIMYWSDVAVLGNEFKKYAKNYGLVREFKKNGII